MTTTYKTIRNRIVRFGTSMEGRKKEAQAIAMEVFMHAAPKEISPDCAGTGDVTLMLELAKVLPTSWQVQLNAWLKANTPIRVKVGDKTSSCGYDAKYKAIDATTPEGLAERLTWWNIQQANVVPFYETVKEPTVEEMTGADDVVNAHKALIKRFQKRLEDDKVKAEERARVTWLLGQLRAVDFTMPKVEENPTNVTKLPKEMTRARRTRKAA